MELSFTIRPGVDPLDRGEIEDRVLEALGEGADLLGGGGMVDGSESDFTIEVDGLDNETIVARCRDVISLIAFTMHTRITLSLGAEHHDLQPAIAE